MAQWSLMTYLDVRRFFFYLLLIAKIPNLFKFTRTCELLAYLGYHTAGTDNQLSAITVTKAQRSGGSKKRNTRTVFMGHVIGPPGVGKTTFCQGLLGRTVDVSCQI
jgi:Ras family protein T1